MPKVNLTIKESECRCGYYNKGNSFIVDNICPPICHELWNSIYPSVYALLNGATLDCGNCKDTKFEMKCPDNGRVVICGEIEGKGICRNKY